MLAPSTLSLLVVAAVFAGIFAAFVYYQSSADDGPGLSRYGLTPARTTVASVSAFATVAVVAVTRGEVGLLGRRGFAVLALLTVLLVASANGLAGAVGFARRWRAFHPDSAVSTGRVSAGHVAISGRVVDDSSTAAPVTDREACAFVWSAEAEDPYVGTEMAETGEYREVDTGQGGTVFSLDDGSGPVRVDPEGARLDLANERTVTLSAGEALPRPHTHAVSDVEFDHGDTARRYTEWVAGPGDRLAVAGQAVDDGDRLRIDTRHLTTGSLAAAADRYRAWTVLSALGGSCGVAVAIWGLFLVV